MVELPDLRGVYTWVDDEAHQATMEATKQFVSRLAAVSAQRGYSRQFSSPTSSARQSWHRDSATLHGESCSSGITRLVRRELARFQGRELDTAGDGFFAAFDGPARAVHAASAIRDALQGLDLDIRAGLHTGECEVTDGKIAGIAVSIGARISSLAAPGEVLVSSTVKDLVAGSGIQFDDRGEHQLKGVPDAWRLFAVTH